MHTEINAVQTNHSVTDAAISQHQFNGWAGLNSRQIVQKLLLEHWCQPAHGFT